MRLLFIAALLNSVQALALAPNAALRTAGVIRSHALRAVRPVAVVQDISSSEEFDEVLETAGDDALIVVDYSTSWCGPCKIIAPKFDEFSEQYKAVTFLKARARNDDCQKAHAGCTWVG